MWFSYSWKKEKILSPFFKKKQSFFFFLIFKIISKLLWEDFETKRKINFGCLGCCLYKKWIFENMGTKTACCFKTFTQLSKRKTSKTQREKLYKNHFRNILKLSEKLKKIDFFFNIIFWIWNVLYKIFIYNEFRGSPVANTICWF